jgi:hypothetical protein
MNSIADLGTERMKPRRILHVLGTAEPAGTAIFRIVEGLAAAVDPAQYRWKLAFYGRASLPTDCSAMVLNQLAPIGTAVPGMRWEQHGTQHSCGQPTLALFISTQVDAC